MRSKWERFLSLLGSRVDGASLAMFRISFGAVMVWETYRLLAPVGGATRLDYFFTGRNVTWNLPYHGFEWLQVWPEPWMAVLCWAMGVASLLLALGLFSRLSAAVVCLTWTYLFLLDETRFNNHYYLQSLIAFLLIWMPSGECFSLDRAVRAVIRRSSSRPHGKVPFWTVFLLRSQLLVMYVYGGIAKLTADWLIDAQPMRLALVRATEQIGDPASPGEYAWLHQILNNAAVGYFLAYSGLLFDLSIGFLLLIRRTRWLGLFLLVTFHTLNHFVIFGDIATFPLLGMAASLIFFDPDWPRRLVRWVTTRIFRRRRGVREVSTPLSEKDARSPQPSPIVVTFVLAWLGVQLVVPLRHYFIPGDVNWTCEGGRFAWRMKGTARACDSLRILISDPEIIHLDKAGQPVVNRERWTESPVVYRQVNTEELDWTKLPEIVVIYQPLSGEIIYYNRWATGRLTSINRARWHIERAWQEEYGREVEIIESRSLSQALDDAATEVARIDGATRWLRFLDRLKEYAEIVENRSLPPNELWRTLGEFRVNLNYIVANRQVGGIVREHLAKTHPFALEGYVAEAPFLIIDDPELIGRREKGLVYLDRDAWHGSDEVYIDGDHSVSLEWAQMPQTFLTIDMFGRAGVAWNQLHDLTSYQEKGMSTYPFMIHQYVDRVAHKWQQKYGSRPAIYVVDFVRLNHHPRQLLIDPSVDLASARLSLFGHSDWITRFEGRRETTASTENGPGRSF